VIIKKTFCSRLPFTGAFLQNSDSIEENHFQSVICNCMDKNMAYIFPKFFVSLLCEKNRNRIFLVQIPTSLFANTYRSIEMAVFFSFLQRLEMLYNIGPALPLSFKCLDSNFGFFIAELDDNSVQKFLYYPLIVSYCPF
jgi:hypothetical protein